MTPSIEQRLERIEEILEVICNYLSRSEETSTAYKIKNILHPERNLEGKTITLIHPDEKE